MECELHVVADGGDEADAFMDAAAGSSVLVVRHRAEERHMPELMARSSMLVHLSDDELTPVTPLEAFSFGRPVVASALPAFEEALDGEAHLVETATVVGDPSALADVLAAALLDQDREVERRAVAERYSWAAAARATVIGWRAVLSGDE